MHDIKDLDSRGIPGGFVASEEFRDAARAQGEALGYKARATYVAHPIQDRTDEEMRELARNAYADVLALIAERENATD